MGPHDTQAAASPRFYDDGAPFGIPLPAVGEVPEANVLIETSFCANPNCPCRTVALAVRPMVPCGEGAWSTGDKPPVWFSFDVDTGTITVQKDSRELAERENLMPRLKVALAGGHAEYIRSRWFRVRGQRPDEWKRQDWTRIDTDCLVQYQTLFPSAWELGIVHQRRRFWFIDSWCLKPQCKCAQCNFHVLGEEGTPIGYVLVDLGKWEVVETGGEALAAEVWEAFSKTSFARKKVKERQRAIREVAAKRPRGAVVSAAPVPAPTKPVVGRNEPCPCGSGKKYKKCCGA
jgi:SEC-C motif domain protein